MKDHLYYTKIERRDGVHAPFPVSRHLLKIRESQTLPQVGKSDFPISSLFEQSASAFFTLVICTSAFALSFGSVQGTVSFFRDEEASRANAFAAGLLGFRLNPGEVTIPIQEGGHVDVSPLFALEENSFDVKYRVHAEVVGTDGPLCNLLRAFGNTSPYIYDGALKDLSTSPATTTGLGHLEVSLPNAANVPNGASCTIALVYEGWHVDVPEGTGYSDEERDTFTFVLDNPPSAEEPTNAEQGTTTPPTEPLPQEPEPAENNEPGTTTPQTTPTPPPQEPETPQDDKPATTTPEMTPPPPPPPPPEPPPAEPPPPPDTATSSPAEPNPSS